MPTIQQQAIDFLNNNAGEWIKASDQVKPKTGIETFIRFGDGDMIIGGRAMVTELLENGWNTVEWLSPASPEVKEHLLSLVQQQEQYVRSDEGEAEKYAADYEDERTSRLKEEGYLAACSRLRPQLTALQRENEELKAKLAEREKENEWISCDTKPEFAQAVQLIGILYAKTYMATIVVIGNWQTDHWNTDRDNDVDFERFEPFYYKQISDTSMLNF